MVNRGPSVNRPHGDIGEIVNWGEGPQKGWRDQLFFWMSSAILLRRCRWDKEKTYEISPNEHLKGVQLKCWEALAVHEHHSKWSPPSKAATQDLFWNPSLPISTSMAPVQTWDRFSWETCRVFIVIITIATVCGVAAVAKFWARCFMWIISPTWILGTAIWSRFYYFLHFAYGEIETESLSKLPKVMQPARGGAKDLVLPKLKDLCFQRLSTEGNILPKRIIL